MIRTLFALFCLCPVICSGQPAKFEWGAALPLFLKVNAGVNSKSNSSLLGATGAQLVFKVAGADEDAMSFLQVIGLKDDRRIFQAEPGSKISTGLFFLNVNPSVLIRSKWEHIKYGIGIGALISLGQSVSTSTSTQSSGTFYSNVDSIGDILKVNTRNTIPYISFGVYWDIKKHLKAQFQVEPTLTNFYESGAELPYNVNHVYHYYSLSYQPVYFGVNLFYFF